MSFLLALFRAFIAFIVILGPFFIAICLSALPHRRPSPENSPAEVAAIMLVVTLGAQGRRLSIRPVFIWDTVLGVAVVAEPPCLMATVYAWPAEHLLITNRENLHLYRHRCYHCHWRA